MKQGNLRNCTKLRNSLLGSGELASLAYGSFKELLQIEELYKIEEPRQGGLVARLRSSYGLFTVQLWPVYGSFAVRLRRF
jgi:hypothetical protein